MSATLASLDTPLWHFSLAVYRREGVQDECLDVQERLGVDVNLLMFCAYVGAVESVALSDQEVADAAAAIGTWNADMVHALRQVRRTLKPWGAGGQGEISQVAEALRVKVKGADLEAERIEQAMLWVWLRARAAGWRHAGRQAALDANVRCLLTRCGAKGAQAEPARTMPHLIEAALVVCSRQTADLGRSG
jgi:uncharacterized protein (TIGR02444 family)